METKKWYQKTWFKILVAILALGTIVNLLAPTKGKNSQSDKPEEEEVKKPSLTMAEVKAKRYIKESLKDPDSFEAIKASAGYLKEYKQDTTAYKYMQVKVQYRAKNSFGGYVVNQQCVTMDADFTPLEMYECK